MAKKVIDVEKGTVSFDFSKDGGEVFVLEAAKVPGFGNVTGTALHAMLHGFSQKIGDSYANAKNQPNPVEWAQQQVRDLIASIMGGVWNAGRTGDGAARVSILARALFRIQLATWEPGTKDADGNEIPEPTEAAAQAFVDSLTKEQVAEYKGKKKVARMLDTIRLEDAQARLERAKAKAAAGEADDEEEGDEE